MKRNSATFFSIGLSVALIALGIWFLSSQYGLYRFGSGSWFTPHGMMTGGPGGLVMILFWVIVIVALILLISGAFAGRRSTTGFFRDEPDAFEILKRRYASGDIDRVEYETKRRELSNYRELSGDQRQV